jgi:hypothetical protein
MEHNLDFQPTQYLRVIGRLYPDQRLRLRPGYLTDTAPRMERTGEHDLFAEPFDAQEHALGRFALSLSSTCEGFGATSGGSTLAVRGWVPFHPAAVGVRYLYGGRVILETRRSPEPPRVRLTWQPEERVAGRQRVQWQAHPSDGESQPLQFFLRYSCTGGQRWQRISLRTTENSLDVDFDELPGGEACLLAVVATDGINTTEERSQPFGVQVKPCHATILTPVDGSRYAPGQGVVCMGNAFYLEENASEIETLVWTSSLDGELGRGAVLELCTLSEGSHRICLMAGQGNRQGYEKVTIQVGSEEEKEKGPGSINGCDA